MAHARTKLPHLLVTGRSETMEYTSPRRGGGGLRLPPTERADHGKQLLQQLDLVREKLKERDASRDVVAVGTRGGFYVEFASAPDFELALENLDVKSVGIEVVATREVGGVSYATVYVPEGQIAHFVQRVDEYLAEDTKNGAPRNRTLIESIHEIRLAALEAFWTDDQALFPREGTAIWWEVWLRDEGGRTLERFAESAQAAGVEVGDKHLRFPERIVVLAWGKPEQLMSSVDVLGSLAELRLAKEVPSSFTAMNPIEQEEWVKDLVHRVTAPSPEAPAVCILDTGVNRGHPLLAMATAESDLHTYNSTWGIDDHHGHGTEMAGIALYGDLTPVLAMQSPLTLTHRIESVKILPRQGSNPPKLYGAITAEGIARAEITAPFRNRAISMSITTTESRDQGQPSSWSANIDKVCSGADDEQRRLFLVSAGNIRNNPGLGFRARNELEGIYDPGQSWNALTVGAYTDRVHIDDPMFANWKPIAAAGCLSPSTTTSCTWQSQWPLKPDIVMEGGNMALSPDGKVADFTDSLSLLTTHYRPQFKPLVTTKETSAATAGAARFAATIWSHYPKFWPETIRALLVHSAEWTPKMIDELLVAKGSKTEKKNIAMGRLLRCFGYGVPDLERALWSANNALTLIVQDQLQPFEHDKNKEMHIHTLPWPTEALEALGAVQAELRVTLSYFVEPNPARRGWSRRHRYASHGLRFAVIKPAESLANFRKRVNKAAREEEDGKIETADAGWSLGPELRSKGSLHQDYWKGMAADLATRKYISVFPVMGWWRERHQLGRWERPARYALVVSVRTRATAVDLYQPVANEIQVTTTVNI